MNNLLNYSLNDYLFHSQELDDYLKLFGSKGPMIIYNL